MQADVGCRNTVFHASAQSAASVVPVLQKGGVRRFRIELVRESPDDVARIVGAYRALLAGQSTSPEVWKTLKAEGLVTRDSRGKERKKYGQKGARARFQFSKR